MDRKYTYKSVNSNWFMISKTNHMFTGSAENLHKEQNLSIFCVHCWVINTFFQNVLIPLGPFTHIQFVWIGNFLI